MAVTRGVVKPIKHGEVRSKGGAMSLLSGLGLDHVNYCQPNFFKTLLFLLLDYESNNATTGNSSCENWTDFSKKYQRIQKEAFMTL